MPGAAPPAGRQPGHGRSPRPRCRARAPRDRRRRCRGAPGGRPSASLPRRTSSRMKASASPVIRCISSSAARIFAFVSVSSTNSACRRRLVIGVLRSCETAASIAVRVAHVAVEPRAHEVERAHRLAGLHRPGLGQVFPPPIAAAPNARPRAARPRIGFAIRRPVTTATAAMPSAESRNTATNAQAPGRRAGRRPHRDVQPSPVRQRHRRREPVGLPVFVVANRRRPSSSRWRSRSSSSSSL